MKGKEHRYECQCCGAYGFAHYVLIDDGQGWVNILLCTGCYEETR